MWADDESVPVSQGKEQRWTSAESPGQRCPLRDPVWFTGDLTEQVSCKPQLETKCIEVDRQSSLTAVHLKRCWSPSPQVTSHGDHDDQADHWQVVAQLEELQMTCPSWHILLETKYTLVYNSLGSNMPHNVSNSLTQLWKNKHSDVACFGAKNLGVIEATLKEA